MINSLIYKLLVFAVLGLLDINRHEILFEMGGYEDGGMPCDTRLLEDTCQFLMSLMCNLTFRVWIVHVRSWNAQLAIDLLRFDI